MDPLAMSSVFGAVDTATSGYLAGAAGEMGRRSSEALAGLVRRMRGGGPDDGQGAGAPLAVPESEEERRQLTGRLVEHARSDPGFARELANWMRDTAALVQPHRPAVAPDASRPRMLPPGTAAFTDRDAVLDEITALLDGADVSGGGDADGGGDAADGEGGSAPQVVALVGPGGIGKTAFAVHCARRLASRFPDGSLYMDLRGASAATALPPSDVLVRFLHSLDVPAARVPSGAEAQTDLYRQLTADRRLVVVLDNAHSAAQLGPLLPAGPGSLTLVTSRYRLPELVRDHGARSVGLGPLSASDSLRLLTRVAGARRVSGHRERAAAVAAGCGGIPLALCETGARVAVREHLSWETLERQFAARAEPTSGEASGMGDHGGGAGQSAGGSTDADVDAVGLSTDLSYRELSPEAARIYRLLGVWPWPDFGIAPAARAARMEEAEARRCLEELAAVHLLEEVAEERYRFHDAVRRHAEERARAEDGHAGMASAVRRMSLWYLGFAAAADLRVIPGRWRLGPAYAQLSLPQGRPDDDGRVALEELRAERENLAAAVRAAEEYGFDELVWQLCEAMWGLHLRLGFHEQWVATHLRGVAAARRCAEEFGDRRAPGRMLSQLSFAYLALGRQGDAETALAEAAAADAAAGHLRGRATAVESLGLLRLSQWRYAEAADCFREAQRHLRAIGPGEDGVRDVPRGLALLAHHLGRALRGQGRHTDATAQLHSALAHFRELPVRDLYNEGRVRMSLGETRLDAGDPAAARDFLDEALATMAQEGAALQQADAAELSARCARELGDPADEERRLRRALAHCTEEGAGAERAAARIRARLAELAVGGDGR